MDEQSLTNESYYSEIIRIIQYNHRIRRIVQEQTNQLINLKIDLIKTLERGQIINNPIVENSGTLFDTTEIEPLNKHVTSTKIQLALVGTNSCGKTSFLHFLLQSGHFLPSDVGPVSARIIRLTYADTNDAALYVYPSLNNRTIVEQISLRNFFLNEQEPDWDGIKLTIKDYVTRPDPENIRPDSDAFAKWATYFVQIQIPSPFLKLGIDLYDTPGLLFSDAPILKKNLCQLVELIQPTLVFMYDNAAIPQDTKDCFLALKDAIGQLRKISIFFLNTKADIDRIIDDADPNNLGIDDEKIAEVIFHEREKRYQLLLQAPSLANQFPDGLPKSIVDCSCFDIISVHSDYDEFAAKFNQTTINRLIEFTANSNLKLATEVSKLVLPLLDAFFDLASTSNHRTKQQFRTILSEAIKWTENYYNQFRSITEKLLLELHNNILEQINERMNEIAQRAIKYQTNHLIENYIKRMIQEEIIEVEIEKLKLKFTSIHFLESLSDICQWEIAERNEFLIAAQRNSNWLIDSQKTLLNKKLTQQTFAKETILAQILVITDVLIEPKDQNKNAHGLSNYQQLFTRKNSLKEDLTPLDFAKRRLQELVSWFVKEKTYLNDIVDACHSAEKSALKKKIHQYDDIAEKSIDEREQLYQLMNIYRRNFAKIQCKITAALNLAKFHGQIPVIHQSPNLGKDMYICQEFLVKKTSDYLEGYYHLRIRQLKLPNILPLLYLSVDENTDELYLYFPNYSRKLKDANLTIQNLFEISYDIVDTLTYLHFHEISHETIQIEHLFLDENNQCYLSNFHWNEEQSSTINSDIYAFGQIGKYLYERIIEFNYESLTDEDLKDLDEYKNLFASCLNPKIPSRPNIVSILQQIKTIRENL